MQRFSKDLQFLAREQTRAAVGKLVELMTSASDERTQAFCAVALLDRAWGRPREQKEKEEKLVEGWETLTYAERIAELRGQRQLSAPEKVSINDLQKPARTENDKT